MNERPPKDGAKNPAVPGPGDERASGSDEPAVGEDVTVQTADGNLFHGQVLSFGVDPGGRRTAMLRLDTGWQVSYPVSMLRRAG